MDTNWLRIANYAEVEEDSTLAVEINGNTVCLYNLNGEIFATDNKCTHGDANLSDGLILDNCHIECPLHEGTFDIRTGKAICAPCTEDIKCHRIRVDDGVIYIQQVS